MNAWTQGHRWLLCKLNSQKSIRKWLLELQQSTLARIG